MQRQCELSRILFATIRAMKVHMKMGQFETSTFAILALITMAIALWWYYTREYPILNINNQNEAIVLFGDSLAYGTGSSEAQGGIEGILERRLNIEILNMGVPGDTTADAERRISSVVSKEPRVVIMSLGGNDFIRRTNKNDVAKRYGRMIARIQDSGAAVIILGVPGYLGTYKDLAQTYQAGYVKNILSGLITNPEFMHDAIHPNDKGYEKVADRIEPVLRRVLGRN